MAYITVQEAATLLCVSPQRIWQLLQGGRLEGYKAGRDWLVDRASVEARLSKGAKAGRPAKHPQIICRYTLMNKNYPVLEFEYDEGAHRFLATRTIFDPERAPIGLLSPRAEMVSRDAMAEWWRHRCIPTGRNGIKAKLEQLGYKDFALLSFASLGFSLSDQYWVRPAETPELNWDELNFFTNPFDVVQLESEDENERWLASVGLRSPDNTSDGMLPKRWICDGERRVLLKGGTGQVRQEVFNEVVASALHERLLPASEFVPYRLQEWDGRTASACECFLAPNEEYIPAWHIFSAWKKSNNDSDYGHLLKCCERMGVEGMELALSKLLFTDYLLANTDRHFRNFGVVRNVDTLEVRPAPIFDTGSSLWFDEDIERLRRHRFEFKSKPFYEEPGRQIPLIASRDWIDVAALEGFASEAGQILEKSVMSEERVKLVKDGIETQIQRAKFMLAL